MSHFSPREVTELKQALTLGLTLLDFMGRNDAALAMLAATIRALLPLLGNETCQVTTITAIPEIQDSLSPAEIAKLKLLLSSH